MFFVKASVVAVCHTYFEVIFGKSRGSPLLHELRFVSPMIPRAWAGRVHADNQWSCVLIWLREPTGNPLAPSFALPSGPSM